MELIESANLVLRTDIAVIKKAYQRGLNKERKKSASTTHREWMVKAS
jgi:hypothetical protein